MTIKNVAKAIVLNPAQQVLLLKRSADDTNRPGEWDFPGGGVESGEDFTAAVTRELAEEAGIAVRHDDVTLVFAGTTYEESDDKSMTRLVYVCHVSDDVTVTLSREHEGFVWLSIDDALAEFPHPVYSAALRHAREYGLLGDAK